MPIGKRFNRHHHAPLHDKVRQLEGHEIQDRCPHRDLTTADGGANDESSLAAFDRQQDERAPVLEDERALGLQLLRRPAEIVTKDATELAALRGAHEAGENPRIS